MALLVGACGDGSVEDTIITAKDPEQSAGARCRAIDDLAIEGESAVESLRALSQDANDRVARCARKAIADITDPGAVDDLLPLLKDGDPAVVLSATEALGRIGEVSAVKPLMQLLSSPQRTVVIAALEALGRVGDPRALPAIEKVALRRGGTPAADKADRQIRWAAVVALGNLGDTQAKATLVSVLTTDPRNARAAGVALTKLFRGDVSPLLPLLEDSTGAPLAYALVDVGQGGTEDALVTALTTYGDIQLAEYFLNCGNRKLEKAAHDWADDHGYEVITTPGVGGGQWGSGV